MYNLRDKYESHAASLEPRSCLYERRNRRGVRMADGNLLSRSPSRPPAIERSNELQARIWQMVKHIEDTAPAGADLKSWKY
jgi:hypothetical protein